ncbi:MAG: WYL domain-containing transcriptional regulator [Clostridia bacterium]|nr:WYL domain-containing transcriptional regulator [Clostridia bacterium]
MENESKLRLLYTGQILNRRTDEDNPLSIVQIIDILKKDYGISAHRTTVTKDIEALREYGMDVCKIESTQNKYFIGNREFEIPELGLLIDAVASSKFMTDKKRKNLEEKICKLASIYQEDQLKSNMFTELPLKSENEKIYYIIDALNESIRKSKKISFQYFHYDADKRKVLKNNGEVYTFSPYTLVWNGDFYYAVGYSHKHGEIGSFRVERIADIPQILEEDAIKPPEDFDLSVYLKNLFRMYNSEEKEVQLICKNHTMDSIIDHFGINVPVSKCDDSTFCATVTAHVSPIFFRWIFGFAGDITIAGPEDVCNKYKEMLKNALENSIGG